MSIAVSIISTIIKSTVKSNVGNELANELIGISVDDVSEKGISKINDFINNGRSKIEKILSKEKMTSMGISEDNIAYVIAEVKGVFSEIEITDKIFRQCKYDSLNLCSFLWNEYSENKIGFIECESDIKKALFVISETLIELIRKSEDFVKDISIQISNTVDDTRIEMRKEFNILKENFNKLDSYNQMILDILWKILEKSQKIEMQKKSRTQEYADKWNANMFLNNFDKRDEKVGVNVKLKDVYLDKHLPHYIWGNNKSENTDLKELLTEYIEEHNENKMLLILGQPGIGKSTLITWITAHFNERVDDILVYQFASDLKEMIWEKDNISECLLEKLGYSYNDLNGKILIFDGLDEWSVELDKKVLLDNLYENLIYKTNIKDFTLIVTCRVNYIQNLYNLKYIILCSWDEKQIESFCSVFQNKTKVCVSKDTIENLINNKNILGIPLVLYMVLALNISFENSGSIVDVYDKIFSLEGGIYDRCIDCKRFADSHRISEIKKQIHQISREIAIWMFENNPDEAYVPTEEYKKICANIAHDNGQNEKDIEQDFIIGNFYKLKHCEGRQGEELYFVHRSIYEYFVAESIYSSIENSIKELSTESQEELASNIAVYLKHGEITNTIGEYFQYKIMKIFSQLSLEKKNIFYDWWESSVGKMLANGMFYYTDKNVNYYKNIISKECQCFGNIIKILRLFLNLSTKKYMLENVDTEILDRYIKYYLLENGGKMSQEEIERMLRGMNEKFNLSKMDLCGANLEGANLSEMDLTGANLRGANLEGANLRGTDLTGANLRGANLEGANLKEAKLNAAKLGRTNLSNTNFGEIDVLKSKLEKMYLKEINLSNTNLVHFNFQAQG